MGTGRISKRSVEAVVEGWLWDEDLKGFGLKVSKNGVRSYVFQYRLGGRETPMKRFTIGRHGSPWTPASARGEAERLSYLVARGIDPRKTDVEQRRQAVELAFDTYATFFLERYAKVKWVNSYSFAEGIVRLHLIPAFGDIPLPRLSKRDISAALDRLPTGSVALRRNVFAVLRRLLTWAVGRGDLDQTPLEGFETPSTVASRDRVLSDAELKAVWQATGRLGLPFGPFFRFLILTGQRRQEAAALSWAELDRAKAVWTLPAARSKNGRTHIVPLSNGAITILDDVGGLAWPDGGFVFSSGKTPISGFSRAKRRLDAIIAEDAQIELRPWRVHDLRRTLATGLQRLDVRFEVTEAVLNHVSGARGGIAGVYQRHDWANEKREALGSWGKHVRALIDEPPVSSQLRLVTRR